jgi:hypothetical protein
MEITITNQRITLSMNADGSAVRLDDRMRNQTWELDEATRLVSNGVARHRTEEYRASSVGKPDSPVVRLGAGQATKTASDAIACTYATPAGRLTLRWLLLPDRVTVTADVPAGLPDGVRSLTLPGTFRPAGGGSFRSAVPNCQGILHTGKGPSFYRPLRGKGHGVGFTMGMFGQIASHGGLVTIAEEDADGVLHWEKTDAGDIRLMWQQHPSMGELGYARQTLLVPSDASVTSVCKTYRRHVREQGRFKSWDEKVAERPILEGLFGAALVFIGYFGDKECDYAASLRGLKAAGIDRAVIYPLLCKTTFDPTPLMGEAMVDQRAFAPLARELGYLPGSFIYLVDGAMPEGKDAFRDLRLDRDGKPIPAWRIRDAEWYELGAGKSMEWARDFLDHDHAGLDMVHFDVLASRRLMEDWHPGHRLDSRGDRENRGRILAYAGTQNRIVSSEGFFDRLTPWYDLGNSKYPHALGGDEYCVVPMTMLVYHDSAYHTWWEVHNYNNHHHFFQERELPNRFTFGGGWPRIQSCMDALMGTPPDIYPFGRQYNFVPENHPQVYCYRQTLDSPSVREAIRYARPVMALNRGIGKLEMIEHRLLHPDGAVQETVFADGTRVTVNFANVPMDVEGLGWLPVESWKSS